MLECNFYLNETKIVESKAHDLYQYRIYIGKHSIVTCQSNSYWYIIDNTVQCYSGPSKEFNSLTMCVEIFGYTPESRSSTFDKLTDLPYINGCSSKQLINPVRHGDPTWQLLYIPPFTSEQAHHIHSTARVVYVQSGKGFSHVGSANDTKQHALLPGMVVVLDKMIPHHFSTTDESLVVLPLHIFSSTSEEHDHPMFKGTYRI